GCKAVSNTDEALKELLSAEFPKGALVVEGEAETCTASGAFSKLAIAQDRGDLIRLEKVKGPGWVVLQDSYYPGWKALDDAGQEHPIFAANVAHRAVYLPEDRTYSLRFEYRPIWKPLSRALFLGAIFLCFGLAAFALFGPKTLNK